MCIRRLTRMTVSLTAHHSLWLCFISHFLTFALSRMNIVLLQCIYLKLSNSDQEQIQAIVILSSSSKTTLICFQTFFSVALCIAASWVARAFCAQDLEKKEGVAEKKLEALTAQVTCLRTQLSAAESLSAKLQSDLDNTSSSLTTCQGILRPLNIHTYQLPR